MGIIFLTIIQIIIFLSTQKHFQIDNVSLNLYALIPSQLIQQNNVYTVISSMMIHENVSHLLGNLLLLWIFGQAVERKLNLIWFIFYYFAIGIAANLLAILYFSDSNLPIYGASGAVSGIIAANLVLNYNKNFLLSNIRNIVRVMAYLFVFFWFVYQIVQVVNGAEAHNIALLEHVTAFLLGIISMFCIMFFCFKCTEFYPNEIS